ncbi:MAG: hypothetical protein J1E03_04300 [Acetatifactor sp.]|nr:hypothetical protein [Acetatifactor sp.]
MVAVTIFWASAFAVIFFLLGVVFKGLAAAFNALMGSSIVKFFKFTGLAAITVVVLFIIGLIVSSIIDGSIGAIIGFIVLLIVVLAIAYFLVGWLGAIILAVAVVAAEYILFATSFVLEHASYFCEKAYIHFLRIIINRMEKC